MWILILTIIVNAGVNTTTITNFSSKSNCEYAGRQWLASKLPAELSYTCINVK